MKKLAIISFVAAGIALVSCSDVKRKPGAIYMPDMAYSRAYETYAQRDSSVFTTDPNDAENRIFYNNLPVAGTVARGEELPFPLAKDAAGDTTNYVASRQIANPEAALTPTELKETERLYLVNCGICHGAKLDGNGPLYKDGKGPYPAKPRNLVDDAVAVNMPDGQMFYVMTYGKNLMGSYASQLTRKQRWQIAHYIKGKQAEKHGGATTTAAAPAASPAATATAPAKDSTEKAK
ncbi:cytochrome c [Danxiaibacter flavus]|uniref:Cytochrome c n=1 Tax=Danxiaibacter flavus TaxID=3049108 RepID=A0ABV3ZKR9_9BACT|nr:cytochrome c [Chitinophagaceae bacterium DXS]